MKKVTTQSGSVYLIDEDNKTVERFNPDIPIVYLNGEVSTRHDGRVSYLDWFLRPTYGGDSLYVVYPDNSYTCSTTIIGVEDVCSETLEDHVWTGHPFENKCVDCGAEWEGP